MRLYSYAYAYAYAHTDLLSECTYVAYASIHAIQEYLRRLVVWAYACAWAYAYACYGLCMCYGHKCNTHILRMFYIHMCNAHIIIIALHS